MTERLTSEPDHRSSPRFAFDRETAVSRLDESRFATEVSAAWNIDTNPNGGYVVSSLIRAAQLVATEASGGAHVDPLAVNTQFLKPAEPGVPATIEVEHLRTGRRLSSLRARLIQQDRVRLSSLVTMGELPTSAEAIRGGPTPPDLPPPEACAARAELDQGVDLPLLSRVDVRLGPLHAEVGALGRPEMAGWIRFLDTRPIDSLCLALFADAFPPSVFNLYGQIGWVPTVELSVHVRRRPVDGWVKALFTTSDMEGGLLIEDGTLWDTAGSLVARSRQLAMLVS